LKNFNFVLAAVAATCLAGAAGAHPHIKTTTPAANAVVASPREISMSFNEPLVAAFSGLELTDKAGHAVSLSTAVLDDHDKGRLVAEVKAPLAPGTYTVKWHAVAADTHHVSGAYSFQVKP
jgi:methionine-rich copper-binding protein CopC